MKILTINTNFILGDHEVVQGNLQHTTPFGYDVIVVNPTRAHILAGDNSADRARDTTMQWRGYLEKWLQHGKLLIVYLRPLIVDWSILNNYHWLPCNVPVDSLNATGSGNHHIGDIVTHDYVLGNFLQENDFVVDTYFHQNYARYVNIVPAAMIDPDIYTAFTLSDQANVVFIPMPTTPTVISKLIFAKMRIDTPWEVHQSKELKEKLVQKQKAINQLLAEQTSLNTEFNQMQDIIVKITTKDVFLSKAIALYNKITSASEPDPEDYYEAIENIEKAFKSEHEMQKILLIPKNSYDTLMRRTNEFRHATLTGNTPVPLTDQEKQDFTAKVEDIIRTYLQYLFNRIEKSSL